MDTTDWNLLAKHVQGKATAEETKRMRAWLDEDPAHQALLERAQAAWAASGDVYQAYAPDTTTAWQAIARRTGARRTGATPVVALSTKTSRRTWLLRAAAVVGLALGLVFLVRLLNLTAKSELAETSTGLRQTKQLVLADGTRVWLNENTTLRYDEDFDDSVRAVYLSGEAFFEVARNERQPFRIVSEGAVVRVLGTSFNVLAVPADTAVVVTVVSGVVALADEDDPSAAVMLEAGERGVYQVANRRVRETTDVPPNALAWHTGEMVFEDQRLPEVGRVLAKTYRHSVVVDLAVADLRLTARFDDQPLDEVLEVLSLTLDIHYRKQGETIYLEAIKNN